MQNKLDNLDLRLLELFAKEYARPSVLPTCGVCYGSTDAKEFCQREFSLAAADEYLSFLQHVRYGCIGSVDLFPPFAGEVAVILRRFDPNLEYDLLSFYVLTASARELSHELKSVLLEWVESILMPWKNQGLSSSPSFYSVGFVLGYLGIYFNCGGDPVFLIRKNIERTNFSSDAKFVVDALVSGYLVQKEKIAQHFKDSLGNTDFEGRKEYSMESFITAFSKKLDSIDRELRSAGSSTRI